MNIVVMRYIILVSLWVCLLSIRAHQYEGAACTNRDGSLGSCMAISSCSSAVADLKKGHRPQICSYDGNQTVVCCKGTSPDDQRKSTTVQLTTISDKEVQSDGCQPIPAHATTLVKTGRKAIDKCIDYLEYVFPCENNLLLGGPAKVRIQNGVCGLRTNELIVGGLEAQVNDFPHMAALGFGNDSEHISWLCEATLVSEFYVLSAAHCLFSRDLGKNVSFVLLGAYDLNDVDHNRLYRVAKIIAHPDYRPNSRYNDIALIKLDKEVKFDSFIRPACLPVEKEMKSVGNLFLATGWAFWGSIDGKADNDFLKKIRSEALAHSDCAKTYPPDRRLKQGIIDDKQVCFGFPSSTNDLCNANSAGIIQAIKPNIYCMFDIVGVASFGTVCNEHGGPFVYTRVSYYTPWIESTIWP